MVKTVRRNRCLSFNECAYELMPGSAVKRATCARLLPARSLLTNVSDAGECSLGWARFVPAVVSVMSGARVPGVVIDTVVVPTTVESMRSVTTDVQSWTHVIVSFSPRSA